MKKEAFSVSIKSGFLTAVKIWASGWIAFFLSLIPLYIWRGSYRGDYDGRLAGENIIMTSVGIIAGFVVLMLMYGKSDEAERLSNAEMWRDAGLSVGIFMGVWMLAWVFLGGNNYLVACCGYHLEILLGLQENNRPTFFAAVTTVLIYGAVYFFALILGTKMARNRRIKRNTH